MIDSAASRIRSSVCPCVLLEQTFVDPVELQIPINAVLPLSCQKRPRNYSRDALLPEVNGQEKQEESAFVRLEGSEILMGLRS